MRKGICTYESEKQTYLLVLCRSDYHRTGLCIVQAVQLRQRRLYGIEYPDIGADRDIPWYSHTRGQLHYQYFACRIFTDSLCAITAYLLGGLIGIGTLLCALCLGPFTQFFDRTVSSRVMPE